VAGKTPPKAVRAFTSPIQSALTCFVDGRVQVDSYDPAVEGVLQFNGGDAVKLDGSPRLHLFISMRYKIVESGVAQKPWKIHTTGWAHSLLNRRQEPVVDFHWHPDLTPDIQFPHLHVYSEPDRRHFPTGRVLIEDVLCLAVEMGAVPRDGAKWQRVSRKNIENFKKGATWGLPT
jgi:hypothetical protein